MKKKILGLVVASSLVLGGSVLAAGNGMFKAFPIVNVMVNGEKVQSPVPAINFHGSTLVPLRAVSESLGADVQWDGKTSTAVISSRENSTNNNQSFVSKDEFKDMYYKYEVIRYLFFMTENIGLAVSIINGTDSVTQENLDRANRQLTKIEENEITGWQDFFRNSSLPQSDIDTLVDIGEGVKNTKTYIQSLDYNKAFDEIIYTKSRMNMIHQRYDDQLEGQLQSKLKEY